MNWRDYITADPSVPGDCVATSASVQPGGQPYRWANCFNFLHQTPAIGRLSGRALAALVDPSYEYRAFVRGPDGFIWTYLKDVLVRIDAKGASVHVVSKIEPMGHSTLMPATP
jgi:hypothetical protein